jgi:hypothetical protein
MADLTRQVMGVKKSQLPSPVRPVKKRKRKKR